MRIELCKKEDPVTECKCENCEVCKSINNIKDFIIISLIACAIALDFPTTLFIVLIACAVVYGLL